MSLRRHSAARAHRRYHSFGVAIVFEGQRYIVARQQHIGSGHRRASVIAHNDEAALKHALVGIAFEKFFGTRQAEVKCKPSQRSVMTV